MIVANPPIDEAMPVTEQAAPPPAAGSTMEMPPAPLVTQIRPAQGWQWINFGELWQFRELIYFLTWRDVKIRYKQTVLGASWAVLQPLLMMVVFTIFFGRMAGVSSGDLPYPLFAYAGLLPWTFFATAIAAAGNSVVGSERLITKIYFPRLAIPFAAVGAAVVDFVVALGLLIVMMTYYRIVPGPGLLLLPAIFGAILIAGLGVGTLLAALNVAYRDFRYVIPFLVQIWMFATPTVYMQPKGTPSGWAGVLLLLNPMTSLVAAFRAATLDGTIAWDQLGTATAAAVLVLLLGCFYFRRVEDTFADII
jgi:lipopolysaccharide transport system permease protein